MAELFGFRFNRIKNDEGSEKFTPPPMDDGSIEVAGGGFFSQILDTDGRERTELDLIRRYRDIAQQSEVDSAIEDIINEGIVSNERAQAVSIVLDQLPYPMKIKKRIQDEFDSVLQLLDFDTKGHDIFRRWYIDGRLFYHKVIDKKNPKRGVMELRYIDPRKIRKVKEITKENKGGSSVELIKKVNDYYMYNDKGLQVSGGTQEGLKIAPDSIVYVPSGLIDQNKGHILSYLHKAIKPVNQLRMIEDSLVIYRVSRAPERRIFYIDVGNLPKVKAEQYLKDVMNRYRNKLTYDASTGEIRDDRNHMSMLEDFWLPRREGGRGTEITTLAGGSNLGEIEDIKYFQTKLYRSLNVPISRMESESQFSLGRSTEITRDELKFTKFVQRLRKKFTPLFTDILKTNLVLKGVITLEDWDNMVQLIQYDFLQDGHFAELKRAEMMESQMTALQSIESYIGTFFSKQWVQRNVLNMTEIEIVDMQDQINQEAGVDPEDGGIDVPDNTDGVTRYPQDASGAAIAPDDIEDTDSDNDEEGVDDMESDKDFMLKNSKKRKKK
jgi:hypothetical protein